MESIHLSLCNLKIRYCYDIMVILSFVEIVWQCRKDSTAGTQVCKMVVQSHDAAVLHVVCRASGQALAGTIALHEADGSDKCLLEARLWLTASRGTIDTIFDMLSQVRYVCIYQAITKSCTYLAHELESVLISIIYYYHEIALTFKH